MIALIIIGVIVAIITAIMLIPVGADISYEDGQFALSAKVCGILLQLFPKPPADESKPKKEKKPKKPKKPKKQKAAPEGGEAAAAPKKKLNLQFSKDEILSLVKKVLNKFGRFGRKFKVDRFLLRYIAAGKDPYDTAVNFAYVNAALSSLAPLCSQRFDVKDCEVWTDIDFTVEKKKIDFGLAFTIRIGAFFALAFGVAFSALGIFIKNKTRLLLEKIRARKNKSATAAAEDTNTELIEENIKPDERNENHG